MMLSPSDGLPDDRRSTYSQSQSNVYTSGDKTSPISVILVSSGSRGNKLLFRYPFQKVAESPSSLTAKQRNPYALNTTVDTLEDQDGDSREQSPLTDEQLVAGFSDIILATILATKSDMCGKKFELKIDNVRFVGHPTLLQHSPIMQAIQNSSPCSSGQMLSAAPSHPCGGRLMWVKSDNRLSQTSDHVPLDSETLCIIW